MGIEPTPSAWKAEVLPLNYTRQTLCRCTETAHLNSGDTIHLVEGGGSTPGLQPSALRAAALCAAFEIAPGDFVNLHRFPSSPAKTGNKAWHLVEGGGFEPPKAEPSDLQSDPFDHSGTPPKCKPAIVLQALLAVNSNTWIAAGQASEVTLASPGLSIPE
jgi:hypothetical protein